MITKDRLAELHRRFDYDPDDDLSDVLNELDYLRRTVDIASHYRQATKKGWNKGQLGQKLDDLLRGYDEGP